MFYGWVWLLVNLPSMSVWQTWIRCLHKHGVMDANVKMLTFTRSHFQQVPMEVFKSYFVGMTWSLFLIGQLYLSGIWLGM